MDPGGDGMKEPDKVGGHTLALAIAISVALVAVLGCAYVLLNTATASTHNACDDAIAWHLRAAMNETNPEQDYHLNAARAARSLEDNGQDCTGWDTDRGA
jgi:hypothetical protein